MDTIENSQSKDKLLSQHDVATSQPNVQRTVHIFCFDISTCSRHAQFLLCVGGVLFFYLTSAYCMVSPCLLFELFHNIQWIFNLCNTIPYRLKIRRLKVTKFFQSDENFDRRKF